MHYKQPQNYVSVNTLCSAPENNGTMNIHILHDIKASALSQKQTVSICLRLRK